MKVFVYEHVTAALPDAAASLTAEGKAMLSAISSDFLAIPNIELLTLSSTSPSFSDLAAQADYTLIIAPEFDGILERLARQVLEVGGRLLGPSPEAIQLTADKLDLHVHWLEHQIPSPTCYLWNGSKEPSESLVIKPRNGAGSQATRRGHLEEIEKWGSGVIAQDYVSGKAASVAFLVGPNHLIPLLPTEQLLSTDGRFHYRGCRIPISEPFAERAVALARRAVECVPGLSGYVGVDLVLEEHPGNGDWAIEINPRLTTSYLGLQQLAQFNLAEAMLKVVQGEEPAISWKSGQIEFTVLHSK